MVHKMTCEKTMVDTDHFLGHKNGKLYLNDSSDGYNIDMYCVEFVESFDIQVSYDIIDGGPNN